MAEEKVSLPEELTNGKIINDWYIRINVIPSEYINKTVADGEITARIIKENTDYANSLKSTYKLDDKQYNYVLSVVSSEAKNKNVYTTIKTKVLEQASAEKLSYSTLESIVFNELESEIKAQTDNNIKIGLFPHKEDILKEMQKAADDILERAKKNYNLNEIEDKETIDKLKTALNKRLKNLYSVQIVEYEKAKANGKITNDQSQAKGSTAGSNSSNNTSSAGSNKNNSNSSSSTQSNSADLLPISADYSNYTYSNVSYSGCDMVVSAQLAYDGEMHAGGTDIAILGSLQTITYSLYDKMAPIHALGNVNAKDYVHTHRTVAGSMVFAVFNKHWAKDIIKQYKKDKNITDSQKVVIDEIPPLNITISMANEYGSASRLAIYGVRFFNEGMTMSVNDIYTENTFQFVATDLDYLDEVRSISESSADIIVKNLDTKKTQITQPNNVSVKEIDDDVTDNKNDTDDKDDKNNNKEKVAANDPIKEKAKELIGEAKKNNVPKDDKTYDYGTIKKEALQKAEDDYKEKQDKLLNDYNNGTITREEYNKGMADAKEYYNSLKTEIKDQIEDYKKQQKEEKKKEKEQQKLAKEGIKAVVDKYKKCQSIISKYEELLKTLKERKSYYEQNKCKSGSLEMDGYIKQVNETISSLKEKCDAIIAANEKRVPSEDNCTSNAVTVAYKIAIEDIEKTYESSKKDVNTAIKEINEIVKKSNSKK